MNPSPNLPLHDWACLRTELRWIYDHAPRTQSRHIVGDHRAGNWAWYIRRGEVRIESSEGSFLARAGQWLLVPAERHRQDFSDDAVLISVNFTCQWPSGQNLFDAPPAVVIDGGAHPRLALTATRLARLVRRHFPVPHHSYALQSADYPRFLQFQRAFLDWLDAWFQARLATGARLSRQAGDARITQAIRVLEETSLDARFPAKALGAATSLSAVQLGRLFRGQFALTPLQYWERRRLEHARLCLEASDMSLKELAAHLGFRSNAHFTTWFRRHARTSPGRYRDDHAATAEF